MTHVFIVNETTFNIHLQYLFAGTGYADFEPKLTATHNNKYDAENTLTGMIADISKVRIGDKVLFYVTGCKKFFGVFKIASAPFFQSKTTDVLYTRLNKYLPLRVKIEPYKVYPIGISEEQALDDISNISHPYEMCWSMIYRKLTGMRGCSFVTDFEYKLIAEKIESVNNNIYLSGTDFVFNANRQVIAISTNHCNPLISTNATLDIDKRLYNVKGSHEVHLQAYLTQNFDKNTQLKLKLFNNFSNIWIGNEVICSVGEKRIDMLTIAENDSEIEIRVIELKDEYPADYILNNQLPWYIKWVDQYIVPNLINKNKTINIIPTIIAYQFKRNTQKKATFLSSITTFNSTKINLVQNASIKDVECIYYDRSIAPIKIY